ncbi:hypothetical protein V8G54_033033 [Vigna mungo]|uniref:Uncharacterized protein n=1 Tax=Vigna mungo TaxID=3915 RepID=A0AAQ3MN78_VIGMU
MVSIPCPDKFMFPPPTLLTDPEKSSPTTGTISMALMKPKELLAGTNSIRSISPFTVRIYSFTKKNELAFLPEFSKFIFLWDILPGTSNSDNSFKPLTTTPNEDSFTLKSSIAKGQKWNLRK